MAGSGSIGLMAGGGFEIDFGVKMRGKKSFLGHLSGLMQAWAIWPEAADQGYSPSSNV